MDYVHLAILCMLAQILIVSCKYFTPECRFISSHLVPLLPLLDLELKDPSHMEAAW